MLVATFGPSSSFAGRTITFENEEFVHEVLGPISAAEVRDYDRKGWLEWPMDGMRAWVGSPDEALVPEAGAAREPVSVPTPSASSLARAAWTNRCPACRQAALAPGEPKTPFFGGAPKSVWMCPRCQSEFVQKAVPAGGGAATYELKRAGAAGAAVAKRFAKEALAPEEWARTAAGGVSDGEIASADLESFLGALRDGSTTFRLPEGESPVALKRGELVSVLCPDVILREPRRVTQGVYGGPRVPSPRSFRSTLARSAPRPTRSCTTSTAAPSCSPTSVTRSWARSARSTPTSARS